MRNIVAIIFSLFFLSVLNMYSAVKPYCPDGASWRVDRHTPTPRHETGAWTEISRYKDKDGNEIWGQSACYDPGTYCHLNDWFTWWFPSMIKEPEKPEPQNEFESDYLPFIPCNYDPNTGGYIPCN